MDRILFSIVLIKAAMKNKAGIKKKIKQFVIPSGQLPPGHFFVHWKR